MKTSRLVVGIAIVLILITGLVHLIDAPDAFEEMTYKGMLFIANAVGSLVAAIGIARGVRSWGWNLGLVVAVTAIVGYILSRSVGLPGIPAEPDAWLEPLGVTAMLAEILFTAIAVWVLSRHPASASQSTVSV